ncbi:MAG: hypothetical protein ACRCVU_05055 [Flavobacterium sp.]
MDNILVTRLIVELESEYKEGVYPAAKVETILVTTFKNPKSGNTVYRLWSKHRIGVIDYVGRIVVPYLGAPIGDVRTYLSMVGLEVDKIIKI